MISFVRIRNTVSAIFVSKISHFYGQQESAETNPTTKAKKVQTIVSEICG
jgi:hypothetical protein